MVTGDDHIYSDVKYGIYSHIQWVKYGIVESLYSRPATNITLCINSSSIKDNIEIKKKTTSLILGLSKTNLWQTIY